MDTDPRRPRSVMFLGRRDKLSDAEYEAQLEQQPIASQKKTYTSVPLQNIESGPEVTESLTGASYLPRSEYSAAQTSGASVPPPSYHSGITEYASEANSVEAEAKPEPVRARKAAGNLSMASSDTQRCLCLIFAGVGAGLLLILILVPISFSGLEYYEMGFKRRRTTGTVDTSRTYMQGLHMIGPDYEFKKFQADAHFESFHQLSVFNADRLEVRITANLQYFLRPHQLQYLHKNFDIHYEPVLRKNAMDALKGAATVFTNREMILQRDMIEKALFKAVKERLGGRCCEKDCVRSASAKKTSTKRCVDGCKPYATCTEADFGLFAEVRYFQLHELVAPRGLIERYLKALTLQDENEREKLKQRATVIRKDTEQLVQQKMNEAAEIAQNATAWSALINARADAEAKATVEKSRSEGLKYLYTELGITTMEQKNAFDYLRTLRINKQARLAVDYQTYVSGPVMKGEL